MQEIKKFKVYAGLGGGFGGGTYCCTVECTQEEAEETAYELACDKYESYEGLYGLRDISQIMDEEDCDEDIACEIYIDERDSWLDCYVKELA